VWPFAVGAQQPDKMRRIGVLIALAEDGPETKARLTGFRQGLGEWWVPEGPIGCRSLAGFAAHAA
jgi:putative ABC transport system substrate-binding protein